MMKGVITGFVVAAVAALGGFIPANAQHHADHTHAVPWICTTVTGQASSQWINSPNRFHLVLDVHANGCGIDGCAAPTGLTPQVPAVCIAEGGAFINGQGFPIGNFSFDYKTEYCGALPAGHDVFIFVRTTDGHETFEVCEDFPVVGAHDVWHHEKFDLSNLSLPPDSKFDQIYIGLFNRIEDVGEAQFRNIEVNGIPSIPITKPPFTLSDCFMFFVR